jgi:hypothetical protein
MNFETIAIAIQEDLKSIRAEMVEMRQDITGIKEEVGGMREEMPTKADIREIRRDMATKKDLEDFPTYADVRNIVAEAKEELLKEMDKFKYAAEIDDLNARVTKLEMA